MENNIQLSGKHPVNSYLQHFKIAQFNLRLVIKEEAGYKKRYRPKYNVSKIS
jgi:hypothetical protein